MTRTLSFRLLTAWVGGIAWLVPAGHRARWREEWDAEIWHALCTGRGAAVWRRALGALRDALDSRRPQNTPPSPPGSPRRGLDALMHDVRYAIRSLWQRPAFSLTAIVMLAFGIGATAALFGALKNAFLEPLPWHEPERLAAVYENRPHQEGRDRNTVSLPDFADWRERVESFDSMAAFSYTRMALTGDATTPRSFVGTEATWEFFRTLGLRPALGRDFAASDDAPGADPVVILAHDLWQELFSGDPAAVGQEIRLGGVPRTVIGVLPDQPAYYFQSRFWVPLALDPAEASRGNHRFRAFGRLGDGVTLEAARAELDSIARDLETEYPDSNEGHYTAVHMMRDELNRDLGSGLWIVLALAGVVLLIVCTNVASMQLANALARQREVAVRLALGATGRRVVGMLMVESLVLATIATAAGLVLAHVSVDVLFPPPAWQTGETIDGVVVLFAAGLALGTSLLFGLLPALRLSRGDVFDTIRDGSRAVSGGRTGLRGALVVGEVAMAVVLVVGAALLLRSLNELNSIEPGFAAPDAVAAQLSLPMAEYSADGALADFFSRLAQEARAIPGVVAAGTTDTMPLAGSRSSSTFRIEGREDPEFADSYSTARHVVTPGYLEAMDIQLLRGRTLQESDNADAEPVLVVSDAFAERFFPDEDPLGARINLWGDEWTRIVGVVRGVRHNSLQEEAEPEVYFPLAQTGAPPWGWLVLRRASPELDITTAVRETVAAIDPNLPVVRLLNPRDLMNNSLVGTRRLARIVGLFGTLALLVAATGLYGVISYAVGQRRGEIGLRMALGSTSGEVVRLVVWQGMALVVGGLVLGAAAALAGGPALADVLYGVAPRDPASLGGAVTLLGLVALLATLVPAVRASRVDPANTLRTD